MEKQRPHQRPRIPLSKFGGLYVLDDASPTVACAVEATEQIKITASDELLCHIPKMAVVEPALEPFYVRDDVSLDHLRHGHIDFDTVGVTCNIVHETLITTSPTA